MSPDPLAGNIMNPQSLNRYAYVMNNPTNMIDPLGLEGEDACALYFHLPPGTRCDSWFTGPGGQGFNTPGGMFNTNPFDRCAYITTVDAECGQAPGLWADGTPIYGGGSGVSINGTIGGWGGITGWNPNSPPIYLPTPPLSLADALGIHMPDPTCDFGPCAGNTWNAEPQGNLKWRQFKDKVGLALCGDTPEQGHKLEDERLLWHVGLGAAIGGFGGAIVGGSYGAGVGGFHGMAIGLAAGGVGGAGAGAILGIGVNVGCRLSGRYDQK